MGKYLVGIDEGTTGCKTCVFDFEGNMLGTDYREYPCYYPGKAMVEQKDEDITPALFASCKAAIEDSGVDPSEIVAMGLSSQGAVTGPVDDDGKLVRDFIGWQDLRGDKEVDEVLQVIGHEDYYQISGFPLSETFSITKNMWIRNNEPELIDKIAMWSTNQDYFLKQFGADGYYTDVSSASREGLLDIDSSEWSEKLFDLLGFDINKRPKVVDGGYVAGEIGAEVSEKTGLPVGCKICVGAHDQNCCTFGSGAVKDGDCAMVIGTFGSCFIVSDESIRDPNRSLIVKGNVGIGNFTIEAFANTAASSYKWFRNNLCQLEVSAGELSGVDPYVMINGEIAQTVPGAHGVVFLPYLLGCGLTGNAKARATFHGMTLSTEKKDMARAVMEGICYEMKAIIDAEKLAGINIECIRLSGGATKSDMWVQMASDIFEVPVEVLVVGETGTLGAALYAGVGAGVYKSHAEAAEIAVKVSKKFEPIADNFEAYRKSYKIFRSVYDAFDEKGVYKLQ
jgi:xylulokinase